MSLPGLAVCTLYYVVLAYLSTADGQLSDKEFSLDTLYEWSELRFATPIGFTPDPSYRPNNTYMIGLEEYGDRLFVLTPRQIDIPPATVSTVPATRANGSSSAPLLQPYPNLNWNRMPADKNDCKSTMVSVHQAQRDSCGYLWVLDSGVINVLNQPQRVCQPKIVKFDLSTDQPVDVIEIPEGVLMPNSVLENIVLDNVIQLPGSTTIDTKCTYFAYLADTRAPAVVVVSPLQIPIYRLSSPYMYPDPAYPNHTLNGEIYTEFGGIIGITLVGSGNNRELFFEPYSSQYVFSTSTSTLQTYPYIGDKNDIPVTMRINKQSGGIALKAISDDIILFNPQANNSINAWNPQLGASRSIAYNPITVDVIFDIVPCSTNPNLYHLSSVDFPRYIRRNVNTNAINQRILNLESR